MTSERKRNRSFHSYGPVNSVEHFCVNRDNLVEQFVEQLIGNPEKGGFYFTVWAPRQTGKTWLMQQAKKVIPARYKEEFSLVDFSLGRFRDMEYLPKEKPNPDLLPWAFWDLMEEVLPGKPKIQNWKEWNRLFLREDGLWNQPLLLMIDEVDTVPAPFLDFLVGQFREMVLHRGKNWLHGLALIGIRAVIGVESQQGSPFNVQKSLKVPNFSREEIQNLFEQYQEESGNTVVPEVVENVFQETHGQPGLVSWFGELLHEEKKKTLEKKNWESVMEYARTETPNNNLLNLIAKARDPQYQTFLFQLFGSAEIPFFFHNPLHNFLFMHGVITPQRKEIQKEKYITLCRFSSPFIQKCLFDALIDEFSKGQLSLTSPLEVGDNPVQLLTGNKIDLPAIVKRYRDYLKRLQKKGINPWEGQPQRKNLNIKEASGHFHMYSWLMQAFGKYCIISPEFPTGNGQVDLHLEYEGKRGILEIKSFTDTYQLELAQKQAVGYAHTLGLKEAMLVLFAPFTSDEVLKEYSGVQKIKGIEVNIELIGMQEEI